jgi:hypothetical protein
MLLAQIAGLSAFLILLFDAACELVAKGMV